MATARLVAFLVSAFVAITYLGRKVGAFGLLFERGTLETEDDWRRISSSPEGEKRYPPQGMTVVDGELIVTNHWNGRQSGIYRIDPDTGEVLNTAIMPSEAKHTSGLTWDGEQLWAVDHASNRLYELDLAATFADGQAVVEQQYDTGLRGSSGLTLLEIDGREYLAVSDFVWTIETTPSLPVGSAATYIAPKEAIENDETVRAAATVSYPNGGYSQGLTWDGTYLYESLNNLGTDRIEVLDVTEAIRDRTREAIERRDSFEGPASRIEDLGTDGTRLWTTDEGDYSLYYFDSLDRIKRRLGEG